MGNIDFTALTIEAKAMTGLTPNREQICIAMGDLLKSHLPAVTDSFYETLQTIPKAAKMLEGRVDRLKAEHLKWLNTVFTGPYDEEYCKLMYHVGDVHVRVNLPSELMAAGTILIGNHLLPVIAATCGDATKCSETTAAVNAVLGYSLVVMQQAYQASSLDAELNRVLTITGISRALFNNLALAYK